MLHPDLCSTFRNAREGIAASQSRAPADRGWHRAACGLQVALVTCLVLGKRGFTRLVAPGPLSECSGACGIDHSKARYELCDEYDQGGGDAKQERPSGCALEAPEARKSGR